MPATQNTINGLDLTNLETLVGKIRQDPAEAMTRFAVTTDWVGGARTSTRVAGWEIGGEWKEKDFTIEIDEPEELLGSNQSANPQEFLMAAVNACIGATYVALCSLEGITLECLRLETEGKIDLRGFLAIDPDVANGYESVSIRVTIKGDGTPEQFERVHNAVRATSPNLFNLEQPVRVDHSIVIKS